MRADAGHALRPAAAPTTTNCPETFEDARDNLLILRIFTDGQVFVVRPFFLLIPPISSWLEPTSMTPSYNIGSSAKGVSVMTSLRTLKKDLPASIVVFLIA